MIAPHLVVHSLNPGEPVGADLSCTSPIYRPWCSSTNFPNAPLSMLFYVPRASTQDTLLLCVLKCAMHTARHGKTHIAIQSLPYTPMLGFPNRQGRVFSFHCPLGTPFAREVPQRI